MKSKRLIALLIIFVIIVGVVALNSTIFALQTVELNWLTTRVELKGENTDSLLKNVDMPLGESVFFLNKNKIMSACEKNNAYLQVVSIETVFPNKIVMHVAERRQLYSIKISDSSYAIIDKNLKVMNLISSDELFLVDETIRPVIVSVTGFTVVEDDIAVGEKISLGDASEMLKSLTISFLEAKYNEQTMRGFINTININLNNKDIIIITRYGLKICIKDSDSMLTEKVVTAIAAHADQHSKHITIGKIEVFLSELDGKIHAVHTFDS